MVQSSPDHLQKGIRTTAQLIAKGRKDPVFFGEQLLGIQFHSSQKIWLWLTTKTQIQKAVELAIKDKLSLPLFDQYEGIFPVDVIVKTYEQHPFLKNVLCPSNRFGKTFVTSVKHIWYNFYKIGMHGSPEQIRTARYQTLNISPHSMQVDAAYRYIVDFFNDKFVYWWYGKRIKNQCKIKGFLKSYKQQKREIVFSNNSSIKGVPTGEDQASSLAGTQFFYISYDEAPQSLHLRAELPAKIQSRLIDSGGPMDIIGTPEVDKPSHGFYFRIVKKGLKVEDGFFTLLGTIMNNPFIRDEEKFKVLESIRQTDEAKYRQVAFGDFISTGAKLFPAQVVDQIFVDESGPEGPVPYHDYLISVDWGFANSGDPTVIYIFDYTEVKKEQGKKPEFGRAHATYRVVYHESMKGASPYVALAKLKILQDDYNQAHIIHDSTSMGGTMIKKMLREMKVRNLHDFYTTGGINGSKDEMLFLFSRSLVYNRKASKDEAGSLVEGNLNFGRLRSMYIPELEEQMTIYTAQDHKIEQDEVMSCGMGVWWLEKKLVPNRVKVYNINILANKPDQILKASHDKSIKTRELKITERIIS